MVWGEWESIDVLGLDSGFYLWRRLIGDGYGFPGEWLLCRGEGFREGEGLHRSLLLAGFVGMAGERVGRRRRDFVLASLLV